jgi:hypothetical protein
MMMMKECTGMCATPTWSSGFDVWIYPHNMANSPRLTTGAAE